jgi:hypothetical protein
VKKSILEQAVKLDKEIQETEKLVKFFNNPVVTTIRINVRCGAVNAPKETHAQYMNMCYLFYLEKLKKLRKEFNELK